MIYRQILIAAALMLSWSNASASEVKTGAKQMEVNGATLTYVDEGSGDPVVFVHGAISDRRVWDGYRDRIADDHRFIAYTQRYFGTADWPDEAEHFSRETHTDDLIGFVEGLDAGPVHLVTWSYSGGIGTYAALQRPDLFHSIVHYEPAAQAFIAGVPGANAARKEMLRSFDPAMKAFKTGEVETASLRFLEAVFKMPEGEAANEPEPWPTYWRNNGRTILPFLKMPPGAPISCDELGALQVPTLVVQGKNTYTRFSMMAENLAGCLGNAALATVEGANHDGPYRKPAEFAALIEDFHSDVDARRRHASRSYCQTSSNGRRPCQ